MNGYLYYKYIHSISQFNVLPVTSRCNFTCVFCSHNQNPPQIETFRTEDLTPRGLEDIIDFLNSDEKIIIGEAATRIIEGEPFCNPHLPDILFTIRKRYPKTTIHISTNGSLFDEKTIETLSTLKPLEIQISVNILEEKFRKIILGKKADRSFFPILKALSDSGIPFSTSMVILPLITGWDVIEETIKILDKSGTEVIKLFWPSITDYTDPSRTYLRVDLQEIKHFYEELKPKISSPVLLEPPLLENLNPVTEGAISGSPGDRAGIKAGDEIMSINGYVPPSRVEAFKEINRLKNPQIDIKRNDELITLKLIKEKGKKSGLTFLYDLDYEIIKDIKNSLRDKSIIITSGLAYKILTLALAREGIDVPIIAVKNEFFGGNIACAGLLTVNDIVRGLGGRQGFNHILLPSIVFDERGCDLTGTSYLEIEKHMGCKVKLV